MSSKQDDVIKMVSEKLEAMQSSLDLSEALEEIIWVQHQAGKEVGELLAQLEENGAPKYA